MEEPIITSDDIIIYPPGHANLADDFEYWGYVPEWYKTDDYTAWFVQNTNYHFISTGIFPKNIRNKSKLDYILDSVFGFSEIDIWVIEPEQYTVYGNIYKIVINIPDTYPPYMVYRAQMESNKTIINYEKIMAKAQGATAQLEILAARWLKADLQRQQAEAEAATLKSAMERIAVENRETLFEGGKTYRLPAVDLELHFGTHGVIKESEDFDLGKFIKDFPAAITTYHISRTFVANTIDNKREKKRMEKFVTLDSTVTFELQKPLPKIPPPANT